MDIAPFIKELLFRHSCVTVPGLGSFMSEEQGSDIIKKQNRLQPPSKSIAFNVRLIGPDTLLGTYISTKKHISYDSSMYFIEKYVKNIHATLDKTGLFEIKGIGQFSLGNEKQMLFSDSGVENFLIQSFGFTGIQALPIRRESTLLRLLKTVTFRSDYNSRARYRKVARLAYLFVLIACCLLTIYSSKDFKNTIQYSDLNPFSTSEKPEEAKPEKLIKTSAALEEKIGPVTPVKNEKINPDTIAIRSSVANSLEVRSQVTEIPQRVEIKVPTAKFLIIGGVFSKEANARRYIKELKSKGINATMLPSNGFTRVSLGNYNDEVTARKELGLIKSNSVPDAWLLAN